MSVKIIADSSCDLWEMEGVNFEAVPLTIMADDKEFVDNQDNDLTQMLRFLESYKGTSSTACPGVEQWMKAFEGADILYVLTLSKEVSGTYNSAILAKDLYLEEHPEVKIHVFDTLTTGPEMRLMTEYVAKLVKDGKEFEEVIELATKYREHTNLFFAFKSIHNLAQNGRVNKVVAQAVGIMGISILGERSKEGTVEPKDKCRGEKKVLAKLMDYLKEVQYNGGKVDIAHVENEALAQKLADLIKEQFKNAEIAIYPANGLISYYAEAGGVLLACENK